MTWLTSQRSDLLVSHIPLLLDRARGERGTLMGHMARANPQWRALDQGEVLCIFSGPHAYISPAWYTDPNDVPTWNHVAIHASGTAQLLSNPAALDDLLDLSIKTLERQTGTAWSYAETEPGGTSMGRVGTPAYMSPEQARGETEVSYAADVFALGAVLYECVSGERAEAYAAKGEAHKPERPSPVPISA